MPYPGGLFSLGGLQVFKSAGVMAGLSWQDELFHHFQVVQQQRRNLT